MTASLSREKPEFAILCRNLRVNHKPYLKQREVAKAIGIAPSTYGNVESSMYMVVGQSAAHRIANFYELNGPDRDHLLAAWRKLPLSPYGEKRKKEFSRRNAMRSKAKLADKLKRSLAECLGLMLPQFSEVNEGKVCACAFDSDELCEVCMALDNLGLDTYTTLDKAISDIAGLQSKLEAERAQNGATP